MILLSNTLLVEVVAESVAVVEVEVAEVEKVDWALAPLEMRLESKLAAASGEMVCVWAGRVKMVPEARTTVTVVEPPL